MTVASPYSMLTPAAMALAHQKPSACTPGTAGAAVSAGAASGMVRWRNLAQTRGTTARFAQPQHTNTRDRYKYNFQCLYGYNVHSAP